MNVCADEPRYPEGWFELEQHTWLAVHASLVDGWCQVVERPVSGGAITFEQSCRASYPTLALSSDRRPGYEEAAQLLLWLLEKGVSREALRLEIIQRAGNAALTAMHHPESAARSRAFGRWTLFVRVLQHWDRWRAP